jgi:hypothetical protein
MGASVGYIARKLAEYLEGRKDSPVHFLGAMVLDQKQAPTTHVEKRQVIDGQQRLTTLQIFLAAFRDFCREQQCEDLARECESLTFNKGMMANPQVDKFKVWPTQADRDPFSDVLLAGSRVELEKKHPLVRQKFARKDDPRPLMIESYFVRRAVCGFTTKNYTRTLLALIRALNREEPTAEAVYKQLSELKGESSEWPTDQQFRTSWETRDAYHTLNNPKMVHVL